MVEYRLANELDFENIIDFHNRFSEKKRTFDQFLWEFQRGPHGKSIYVIAIEDNKIVGTNSVIPVKVTTKNGQIFLTGKSEDTLIDPDYRGQNIFKNIFIFLEKECLGKGINFIWGYTSAIKPFKKIGFNNPFDHQQSLIVGKILPSYKYLSNLNTNNNIFAKFKILILCFASFVKHKTTNIIKQQKLLSLRKNIEITTGVDLLVKNSIKDESDKFFILQDNEYQKWRIYDNPNYFKVHTFGYYDNHNLLKALVILNSNTTNIAYIIQSSFNESLSKNEKVAILKNITEHMFKSGISLIRNWHFDTTEQNKEETEIFIKAGFIKIKRGIGFVWKSLSDNRLKPENFYLNRISTEGVI